MTNALDTQLGGEGSFEERDIAEKAWVANETSPGLLDHIKNHLHDPFPQDLRNAGVRKVAAGRHRIYFNGKNTDCNYTAFYIKQNKQGDNKKQDDNNPAFHAIVRRALADKTIARVQRSPAELRALEEAKVLDIPEYKKSDWYKTYVLLSEGDKDA